MTRQIRGRVFIRDATRRAHHRTQAVVVETSRGTLRAAALDTVAGNQDERARHQSTQTAAVFGESRADHRADGAVARIADERSPKCVDGGGYRFIERLPGS